MNRESSRGSPGLLQEQSSRPGDPVGPYPVEATWNHSPLTPMLLNVVAVVACCPILSSTPGLVKPRYMTEEVEDGRE